MVSAQMAQAPPKPQPGWVTGIVEIQWENLGVGSLKVQLGKT